MCKGTELLCSASSYYTNYGYDVEEEPTENKAGTMTPVVKETWYLQSAKGFTCLQGPLGAVVAMVLLSVVMAMFVVNTLTIVQFIETSQNTCFGFE